MNDFTIKMGLMGGIGRFVGNSDSGLLHVWRPLVAQYPDARWIVIIRNPYEAAESYHEWFKVHPYKGQPEQSLQDTTAHFEGLAKERDALSVALGGLAYVIEMDDWTGLTGPKEAWHHVFQGAIQFDTARYVMLDDLRVNPMSEKIELNVPQVSRLLESVKG